MKKLATQLLASLMALAGLLYGVAAQATNLAELPLKASVLAKPNVVFAMDESGSMDAEVMLTTFQGYFWWTYYGTGAGTGYTGSTYKYGGNSSSALGYDWNYFYLFPTGTGAGNRVYGDSTNYGLAIPPIPALGWLRSSSYNPIYYDSTKTYKPWPPAYVNSATTTFSNANASAAKSHPVNGTTTVALNADLLNSTSNWRFTFTYGMTIPTGATVHGCYSGAAGALPYTVSAANWFCMASMSYYPATFWTKESCTADGVTCVTVHDGQTIKRNEIKSGNTFPSGRSYADEMQNFANWFTYYRKRRLMLGAAMGGVLENLTGLRMGVVPFNANAAVTMYDSDATNNATNRLAVMGKFYAAEGSGGTPTRETLVYVGNQFINNTGIVQYSCQRNAAFVVTDGFAFANAVTVPAYTAATYGGAAPYTTTHVNTLADIALSYYTNNIRPDLTAGRVPTNDPAKINADLNSNPHMNTYGVTLGAKGALWLTGNEDAFTAPYPAWINPSGANKDAVDDLWHATVNGRGRMYLATDVANTTLAIQSGISDILSQVGAQGGLAVSSVNLDRGDSQAYLGTYNPAGWAGDLKANPIDPATGAVGATSNWSANTVLTARDWTTRVVVTTSGSSGLEFTSGSIGSAVNPDSATYTNDGIVNYLRGKRDGEGSIYRQRSALIGAVINAEPVLDRDTGMVYLASSEGMLHAISTSNGVEQWAYVPYDILATIGQQARRGWVFKTQLDASPTVRQLSDNSRLLVGGLGAAGRGYYAIDVTAPKNLSQSAAAGNVKWTFPTPGDTANRANMGYTLGKALITKSQNDGDVVLVTSGYDNGSTIGDGKGRLWMLNASTGAVLHEFITTDGGPGAEAGLAQVSALRNSAGVRYVYGGDLLGNLWKFDLVDRTTTKLAGLKDSSGNAQPVTSAPELAEVSGKVVVLVGTGRLLDITDFGSSSVQTFYAVSDGATLANARSNLQARTYVRDSGSATGDGAITGNTVDWAVDRGWYMDLPASEQANTNPTVAYGAVAFVTNVNGGSSCAQSSYLYLLDLGTGKKVADGDYGSGFVSERISSEATSSRVITLRVVDGQLVGTTHRSDNSVFRRNLPLGKNIPPGKNSWREVVR